MERVLKGWGFRIQKSVWSVVTGRSNVSRLHSELEQLPVKSGQVLILRLMANARVRSVGDEFVDPESEKVYLV